MSLRDDQTRFFGKLSAMMEAEVPLLNAFEVAAESVLHPGFKAALDRILTSAYSGTSLTESISAEGSIFSPEVMCLLRHGEDT
ncbi:MAG: type II secretion system F family protein, partial [Planctomycetota bacterium]